MKNFKQKGEILDVVAAADVTSGTPAKLGSAFGVYMDTKKSGEVVPFLVKGVVTLQKDNSNVTEFGAVLYWDDTAKKVTLTAEANSKIGYATAVAGAAATEVDVNLVPTI